MCSLGLTWILKHKVGTATLDFGEADGHILIENGLTAKLTDDYGGGAHLKTIVMQ